MSNGMLARRQWTLFTTERVRTEPIYLVTAAEARSTAVGYIPARILYGKLVFWYVDLVLGIGIDSTLLACLSAKINAFHARSYIENVEHDDERVMGGGARETVMVKAKWRIIYLLLIFSIYPFAHFRALLASFTQTRFDLVMAQELASNPARVVNLYGPAPELTAKNLFCCPFHADLHRINSRFARCVECVPESRPTQAPSTRESNQAQPCMGAARSKARDSQVEQTEEEVWHDGRGRGKGEGYVEARGVANQLWLGYMSELLNLQPRSEKNTAHPASAMPSAAGMHAKLVKADFHGSVVTVRQSKNPALVGTRGIVVHETANTFRIVTSSDQFKVLPKRSSVFAFAVPLYTECPAGATSITEHGQTPSADDTTSAISQGTVFDRPHIEFELYGNQFCFRAAERAGRKFKAKETIEL